MPPSKTLPSRLNLLHKKTNWVASKTHTHIPSPPGFKTFHHNITLTLPIPYPSPPLSCVLFATCPSALQYSDSNAAIYFLFSLPLDKHPLSVRFKYFLSSFFLFLSLLSSPSRTEHTWNKHSQGYKTNDDVNERVSQASPAYAHA